jgi:hypothetical protein
MNVKIGHSNGIIWSEDVENRKMMIIFDAAREEV